MPNCYIFPKNPYDRIKKAAHRADINEICYLLFGIGRTIMRVVRVPNRAANTVCQHVFGGSDFDHHRQKMKALGIRHLGYLHTHPVSEAVPGSGDIAGYPPGTLMFIYSTGFQSLRAFRLKPSGNKFEEKTVLIQ